MRAKAEVTSSAERARRRLSSLRHGGHLATLLRKLRGFLRGSCHVPPS